MGGGGGGGRGGGEERKKRKKKYKKKKKKKKKKKYYRYEIFLNPDLNISEGARVEFEGAGVEFKSKVWVLFDHDTGSTWVTPIDKESGQPGRSWRPLDFERNPQNIPGESSEGTNVE